MKKLNLIIPTALLIIVLPIAVWALIKERQIASPPLAQALTLYYGDGCPHCEVVEEFLTKEDGRNRLELVRKEVYNNTLNQTELLSRAASCKLNTQAVGIPFLWDDGKCLIGDQDIIKSLKEKLNNL